MFSQNVFSLLPLLLTLACTGANGDASAHTPGGVVPVSITPRQQDYQVVASYPHDITSWTQGLFFHKGSLIECTGRQDSSVVREVEITTGKAKREYKMPSQYFGEGCQLVG